MSNGNNRDISPLMLKFENYIEDPLFNVKLSYVDEKEKIGLMQAKNVLSRNFQNKLSKEIGEEERKLDNYKYFENAYLGLVEKINQTRTNNYSKVTNTNNPLIPKNRQDFEGNWNEFEEIFRVLNYEQYRVENLKDMFSAFSYQTVVFNKISLCGFETLKKLYEEFYTNGLLAGRPIDANRFYNTFVNNSYWKNFNLGYISQKELEGIKTKFGKVFYNFDESLWKTNEQGEFTKKGEDSFASFGIPQQQQQRTSERGWALFGGHPSGSFRGEYYGSNSWSFSQPQMQQRQPQNQIPMIVKQEPTEVDFNQNMVSLLDKEIKKEDVENPKNAVSKISNNKTSGQYNVSRSRFSPSDFNKLKNKFIYEAQQKLRQEILNHFLENIKKVLEIILTKLGSTSRMNNRNRTTKIKQELRSEFIAFVKSQLERQLKQNNNNSSSVSSRGSNNTSVRGISFNNGKSNQDLSSIKKTLRDESAGLFNEVLSGYSVGMPDKEASVFINYVFYLYAYYRQRSLDQLLKDYQGYETEIKTNIPANKLNALKQKVKGLDLSQIMSGYNNTALINLNSYQEKVGKQYLYYLILRKMFYVRREEKSKRRWSPENEKELMNKVVEIRNKALELEGKDYNQTVDFWDNILMGLVLYEGKLKPLSVQTGGLFDKKTGLQRTIERIEKNASRYKEEKITYRPFVYVVKDNQPYLVDVLGLAKLRGFKGEVEDLVLIEKDGKKYYDDSFPVIRLRLPKGKNNGEGLFSMNLLYFLSGSEQFYLDVAKLKTGGILTETVIESKIVRPLIIQGFNKGELIKMMQQGMIEFQKFEGNFDNMEKNRQWCFEVLFGKKNEIKEIKNNQGKITGFKRTNGNTTKSEYYRNKKLIPFIFGIGKKRSTGLFGLVKKEIKNNINGKNKGVFKKSWNKAKKIGLGIIGKIYTSDIVKQVEERLKNIEKYESKYTLEYQDISIFGGRYISKFDTQKMLMWWFNIEPVLKYVVDDKPSSSLLVNMSGTVNANGNPVLKIIKT